MLLLLLLFLPGHVPLDFNWILFIFGHISGTATGDGSRNATRHTMTNVDIQMTPLGAEDAGGARTEQEAGQREPLVGLLSKPSKLPCPDPTESDTRKWHSNRLLAMSLDACGRLQSWMGEKSKPFELFELPDLQLLPQSPPPLNATGSRCLKCLRDFVNVSFFPLSFLLASYAFPIEWSEKCVRHLSADAMRVRMEKTNISGTVG